MATSNAGVERVALRAGGPEMSRVIWGSMRAFDHFRSAGELADFLRFLLDCGVTTLDTADIYGDYKMEQFLGDALKVVGGDRRRFEIITKADIALITPNRPEFRIKHHNASAAYMAKALDLSLTALGVETLDLWLVHRPDALTAHEETAAALDAAVAAGKTRFVGVSNYLPSHLEALASFVKAPLVTNQVQFSPLHLDPIEDGTFDLAQRLRFRPQIWSPVGGGRVLTTSDARAVRTRDKLAAVARKLGLPGPAEAALAWVANHPTRPLPVVGSGRRERMAGAIAAVNTAMDRQDWFDIWRTSVGSEAP